MILRRPLLALALMVAQFASAQAPAPPAPGEPGSPPPAATTPAPPPAAPKVTPPAPNVVPGPPPTTPQTVRERERTIYVPYEDLEKVFKDGGKGVFLPYKEFLDLWNELSLKRKEQEVKPPQDGVVSRAEYTAKVEGEVMVINTKITVESFKNGWLTVPLARAGAVPGIAEADTGKAVLWAKPDSYDVILPDKGTYELKLKLYAPIQKAAGKQTVSLVLPQAAVSRFTAIVPQNGWDFEVKPAAAFTTRPSGADTELSFFFGSGAKFDVSWSKPEQAVALTPLLLASSAVNSEVHAGSLTTTANFDVRVLRAPVGSFTFLLPADQTVQAVTGNDVKDWKLDHVGANQKLTITSNSPIRDLWHVKIDLEAPLPKLPTDVTVPDISLETATQDRGDISISAEPQLDVTPKPGPDLVQQTLSSPSTAGFSIIGGYRFLKHPAKLQLSVAEAKPQVDLSGLTVLDIKRESVNLSTSLTYNVRRVGIFDLRLLLPPNWSSWDVVGVPADQWNVEKTTLSAEEAPGGKPLTGELLTIKLPRQTVGGINVVLTAQQPRAHPTDDLTLPTFTPLGVMRYDSKIGVAVQPSLEIATKTLGDLRQDDVAALGFDANPSLNAIHPIAAKDELTLAFRHRDAVKVAAVLSFKARDPQVNVQVLTLMEAKEQSLRHTWTLDFNVSYAATDRFVLAVPKSVAGDIRLVDTSVKEIHKDYKADDALKKRLPHAEEFELWEIILRNEQLNNFQITLSVEKPTFATAGRYASLDLLPVHVPDAFQESGQVAVKKDNSLEIRDSKNENLEEIDPKELMPPLSGEGAFLGFKYKTQPIKLTLEITKNAYIKVPQAIVTSCLLTTAVSTDRAQTTEAIYWVTNNAQQFLSVRLPESARLVSDIFVNGAMQQPMRRENSKDLLVRLPTGLGQQRLAFPVRFVYEIKSPNAGEKLGTLGSFIVEPPTLNDVAVLEADHRLYLPDDYYYTHFAGPMVQSLRDRGWAHFRHWIDAIVPAFGPQLGEPEEGWRSIGGLPPQTIAMLDFQVPTQGQKVELHRLGSPAAIDVSFRSRKISFGIESLLILLVTIGFASQWRRPLSWKIFAVLTLGLLALVSTGLLSAANARFAKAVLLGLLFAVIVWLVIGIIAAIAALPSGLNSLPWRWRRKTSPAPTPPLPPQSPDAPPAASPQSSDTPPPVPPVPDTNKDDSPHA